MAFFRNGMKVSEQAMVKILAGVPEMDGGKQKGMILFSVRIEKCIKALPWQSRSKCTTREASEVYNGI